LVHKFQEILHALETGRLSLRQGRIDPVELSVSWELPPRGWWVLNTDGAVKGALGPAGAGGVLRDDKGEWILGFSEYLGHCSTLTAELKAVVRGLKIAKELGAQKLWVRTDSKILWGMLIGQAHHHPELHFLGQTCRRLLYANGWDVEITHCFRETNQVADRLANIGVTGRLGAIMYQNPPMEIQDVLYADRMGTQWPRRTRYE